jgi:hypothetical protein
MFNKRWRQTKIKNIIRFFLIIFFHFHLKITELRQNKITFIFGIVFFNDNNFIQGSNLLHRGSILKWGLKLLHRG